MIGISQYGKKDDMWLLKRMCDFGQMGHNLVRLIGSPGIISVAMMAEVIKATPHGICCFVQNCILQFHILLYSRGLHHQEYPGFRVIKTPRAWFIAGCCYSNYLYVLNQIERPLFDVLFCVHV